MNWTRPSSFVAWCTFAVALVLRVAYVLGLRSSVLFDAPLMDAAIHDRWARGSLDLLYAGIPYFRAPLYVWFLQAVYSVDASYLAPRLAQALLSAATVGLLADATRRLHSPGAAWAAGLLAAFCWPLIYFSGELVIVTFFAFWMVLALWMLLRAGLEDRPRWAYAASACLGIASMARPTALTMLPVLVALSLFVWPRLGSTRLGQRARILPVMLVLTLLPGLALTLRNQVVGHDLVFIASQGGVNFYIGNNPQSDGSTAIVPGTPASWMGGYRETIRQAVQDSGRPLSSSEVSRYYYRKGLRFWSEQPAAALKLFGLKLRHLVLGVELSNNQNIHFWRAQSPLLSLPIFVGWSILVSLGLVGIFCLRRSAHAVAFWGFLATYGAGVVIFFVNERFRMPLTVVMCLFAGVALAEMVRAARAGRMKTLAGLAAAAIAVFACTGFGRIGFRGDRVQEDAFSRYTVGDVYLDKSRPEEAIRWYREALLVAQRYQPPGAPEMIAAHPIRMARAYALLRDVTHLEQTLDAMPRSDVVNLDVLTLRADLNRLRHRDARACEQYAQVTDRVPDLWQAQVGTGWCLLRQGRVADARRAFEHVLEVKPDEPQALAGLGVLDVRTDPTAARRLLERAIAANPRLPRAHEALAQLDAIEGHRDAARRHLQEAIRLDPTDPRLPGQLDQLR